MSWSPCTSAWWDSRNTSVSWSYNRTQSGPWSNNCSNRVRLLIMHQRLPGNHHLWWDTVCSHNWLLTTNSIWNSWSIFSTTRPRQTIRQLGRPSMTQRECNCKCGKNWHKCGISVSKTLLLLNNFNSSSIRISLIKSKRSTSTCLSYSSSSRRRSGLRIRGWAVFMRR